MVASHKRTQSRQNTDFTAPRVECMACYDTGIVSNSDGLVWNYLPDYDINPHTGKRCGGLDLAIICHCTAAYDTFDHNNSTTRTGFRTTDDVRTTENNGRNQALGILISKEHTREIHRARRLSWDLSVKDMQRVRQTAKPDEKPQLPAYIENVRAQLLDAKNLLPAI